MFTVFGAQVAPVGVSEIAKNGNQSFYLLFFGGEKSTEHIYKIHTNDKYLKLCKFFLSDSPAFVYQQRWQKIFCEHKSAATVPKNVHKFAHFVRISAPLIVGRL